MAFSVSHTESIDASSEANLKASTLNAVDYLWDTYLPARGWIIDSDTTVGTNRKIQFRQRHTNWNNNGADYDMAGWTQYDSTNLGSSNLSFYEDSLLDGNSFTNTESMRLYDTSEFWSTQPWKFWVSDEDSSLILITQGNLLHMYGGKLDVGVVYPNSAQDTSTGQPNWQTYIFPFLGKAVYCNLPRNTNTSGGEFNMGVIIPNKYEEPVDYSGYKNFSFTDNGQPICTVDYSDWRIGIPAHGNRFSYRNTYTPITFQSLYKVQSGSDWYLATNTETESGMLWYCGTTEPEIG